MHAMVMSPLMLWVGNFQVWSSVIFVANVRDQGWKANILHMFVLGSLYVSYCIFQPIDLVKE